MKDEESKTAPPTGPTTEPTPSPADPATAEPTTSSKKTPPEETTPKLELVDCGPCGGTGVIRLKEDEMDVGRETPCRTCEGEGHVLDAGKMPQPSTMKIRYDSGKQSTMHGWFSMIQWPLGKVVHCNENKATLLNFDKIESVETEMYIPEEAKVITLPKKKITLVRK